MVQTYYRPNVFQRAADTVYTRCYAIYMYRTIGDRVCACVCFPTAPSKPSKKATAARTRFEIANPRAHARNTLATLKCWAYAPRRRANEYTHSRAQWNTQQTGPLWSLPLARIAEAYRCKWHVPVCVCKQCLCVHAVATRIERTHDGVCVCVLLIFTCLAKHPRTRARGTHWVCVGHKCP